MEGSSNSNKRKGDVEQEGKGVPKRQNVTMGIEVFDCSICSKPPVPPIFQCSKGNLICSPCRDMLPESERAAAQRCYIMERVIGNIGLVPCKHGCNRMVAYHKKDAHERECPAGPCVCPVSGCGFVGPTAMLLDHLTTLHKFPTERIELFEVNYIEVQPGSQVLCSRQGRLFLLDVVSVESVGHAVSIVCVRPETPRATVDVFIEFSFYDERIQASKIEIGPDGEPRQCLCVLPDTVTGDVFKIRICMVYYDNEELQEEEKEDVHMFEYDFDVEEQDEED